ncbi:GLPGLI family protein [Hugenholtzia roseola]|uniref:GLPGLI family protein n=1 Tax=Hugenholtzia roseola TaxID=1002 RepID=UPI00047D516A|nr:GLPGLI family protein [Hugenholtzia roseola]
MKKTIVLSLLFILSVFSFSLKAQINNGTVVYSEEYEDLTDASLEKRIKQVRKQVKDEALQDKIIETFKKDQKEKPKYERTLYFSNQEALYVEREENQLGIKMGIEKTYFNVKQNKAISEAYVFEKAFVIEEPLPKQDWVLVDSVREITPFRAKMAVLQTDSSRIEAWYTEEIALPLGGSEYGGLKGLILEVYKSDGSALRFKSFSAQVPEKVEIKAPKNGKKVSKKEFNLILSQKVRAMNEAVKGGQVIKVDK